MRLNKRHFNCILIATLIFIYLHFWFTKVNNVKPWFPFGFYRWEVTLCWMKGERSSFVTHAKTLWTGQMLSTSCRPCKLKVWKTGTVGVTTTLTPWRKNSPLACFNDVAFRTHEAMMGCGWSRTARQRHLQTVLLGCVPVAIDAPWANIIKILYIFNLYDQTKFYIFTVKNHNLLQLF